MNYDWEKIGVRIKYERKQQSLSQEALVEAIGLSVQTRQLIGKWEKGKTIPTLGELTKLCEIFECELGYLLCEYDCKTREATDIQEVTGLSEKAINSLVEMKNKKFGVIETVSQVIEHDKGKEVFSAIHRYAWDFNYNQFGRRVDFEDERNLAKVLNCEPKDVRKIFAANSQSVIEADLMEIIKSIKPDSGSYKLIDV